MDAARAETPLRDLEPAALTEQHVGRGHANVLEGDLRMAVRRIVVTEHRKAAADGHPFRVHRHEDHRLLFVPLRVGTRFPHENRDRAARIAGARDPPLVAIDDVLVALALNPRVDVRRIRRGDVGLRHGEARSDRPVQQRLQPLLALGLRAVAHEHFHVAGVRRGTVEDFCAQNRDAAHDFAQGGVFDVGEPGAVLALRQKQIPQRGGARLRFQLLDDCSGLPAIASGNLVVKFLFVRVHMVVHERLDALLQIHAAHDTFSAGEP